MLPYLRVDLEDGSYVTFSGRNTGYGHWLYESWKDLRAKRRERALQVNSDDSATLGDEQSDKGHGEHPSPPPC
jgi:hypothetical protein